jgi:hypothetical protein
MPPQYSTYVAFTATDTNASSGSLVNGSYHGYSEWSLIPQYLPRDTHFVGGGGGVKPICEYNDYVAGWMNEVRYQTGPRLCPEQRLAPSSSPADLP